MGSLARDCVVESMAIRILIVDDSAELRQGLRTLLEAHAGWEVCGDAVDGADGVEKSRLLRPHVIVVDFSMPHMNGIEAAKEMLKESPRVLILLLTLHLTRQLTDEARRIGIRATFSKTATGDLVGGIDALLRGERPEQVTGTA